MISKMTIKGVTHDIKDAGARELIESLQVNVGDLKIPTKTSEIENDSNFLVTNDDYNHVTGRLHVTNNFDDYQERKVDISTQYLMGAENGGLPSTLYINAKCDTDVSILENGTGTLYYKGNEVADRYYVDEQIENLKITDSHTHDNKAILDSISQEDIDNWNNNTGETNYELPIASAGTLGGIKVGMNLSIDADGTLNAIGGTSGEGTVTNGEVLPIGTMIPFGSQNNIPVNWRICDGSEVSRTAYADLFNVIGTSYGEGDGETTFNLPNKKGRISVGLDIDQSEFNSVGLKGGEKKHTLTIKEMPIHSHEFTRSRLYFAEEAGPNALGATSNASNSAQARTLETGGNQAHNNLQPYEVDVWIIKVSNVVGVLETENANVIDNLTSTSTTDVLSANMGRELNEKIENIDIDFIEEYSTEEQVVGKWVDGSTVYRKFIDIGALPNKTTGEYRTGLSNCTMRRIETYKLQNQGNGIQGSLYFVEGSTNCNCYLYNYCANFRVITNADLSTFTGYIIIDYSKNE